VEIAIPWLVIILRDPLTVAWVPADLDETFVTGGQRFHRVIDENEALNEFAAFFDRLRDQTGRLVGIQITPMVWNDLPILAGALPFARAVNEEKQLQVFFLNDVPEQVLDMGDQAFGGRIYRSEDGVFAVTCDTYFLDDEERELIATTVLNRAVVHPNP
jgi:hypothetical protein